MAQTTGIVCLAALVLSYWSFGHEFVLSNDEGIFLEGARRVLEGQVPYRDFFILMGPGSFWLQAAAFKLFGLTLASSRVVTLLDFAAITACVFWLTTRRSTSTVGVCAAALCWILETADPVVALPNHRWDSAAFAILATALLVADSGPMFILLAGVCAAFAAWITPTVGLVGIALFTVLLATRRGAAIPFAGGGLAVSLIAAGVLAAQGGMRPLFEQLLWTGTNYAQANRMPYGSRFGGYSQLFDGTTGADALIRGLIVFGLTLPALLPPIAAIFAWLRRRDPEHLLLSAAAFALLASAYPRLDVPHLTYAAPLFYALLAPEFAHTTNRYARIGGVVTASLLTALFGAYALTHHLTEQEFVTPAGAIRANASDRLLLEGLTQRIPPGSSLFVYPYLPVVYFVTMAQNPTRYSYLQPGMMSDADEARALNELRASPPDRVVYYNVTVDQVLRFWPGSDRSRLRMHKMEAYLREQYEPVAEIAHGASKYQILERRAPQLNATTR